MRKKLLIIALPIVVALIAAVICLIILPQNEDYAITASVGAAEIYAYDSVRAADSLIVYTVDYERNPYGYELLVEKSTGFVIDADDWVELKDGTFILSGHGEAAELLRKAEIGDIVKITNDNVEIYRDMKKSAIKKVDVERERIDSIVDYRRDNLYDIDLEGIEKLELLIEESFDDLYSYCKKDDIDQSTMDKKVNEIMTLLQQKYYFSLESNAVEGRGMWHRPGYSGVKENDIDGVKEFVSKVAELGMNSVYVETYLHGMTVYYSDLLQSQHQIMSSFECEEYENDYFLALISECHKQGIEVHAWVELLNAGIHNWSLPSHIDESWLIYDSDSAHRFLDPANKEVVEYLCDVVEEMISKYDFDGVSYDYIRYSENGSSTLALTDEHKCDAVSSLVQALSERIRSLDRGVIISASPYGYIDDAKTIYKQDISKWLENGYLDLVLPMVYTENVELLTDTVDEFKPYMKSTFQYTGISPIYNGASVMRNMELIDALNGVANGFSLFASQNYISRSNDYYERVRTAFSMSVSRNKAITPTSDVYEVLNVWINQLKSRYVRLYIPNMTEKEWQFMSDFFSETEKILKEKGNIEAILDSVLKLADAACGFESDAVSGRIAEQTDTILKILEYAIAHKY